MAIAYNMHAEWRHEEPRRILRRARANGGTITPYAHIRGPNGVRSWIVSWPDRGEDGTGDPCEGNLYIVRCKPLRVKRFEHERMLAEIAAQS